MNKFTLFVLLTSFLCAEAKVLFEKEIKGVLVEVLEERAPNADEFGVPLPAYHTLAIIGAKGIDVKINSLRFKPVENIDTSLSQYYEFPRSIVLNHLDNRVYSTVVLANNSTQGFSWSVNLSLSIDGQLYQESILIKSSQAPANAKEPIAVRVMERAKTAPPVKLNYNIFDRMMLKVPQGRFNYMERKKREAFEREQEERMDDLEDEVKEQAKAKAKRKREDEIRRKRQQYAANCKGTVNGSRNGVPNCETYALGFDARAVGNAITSAGNQIMQARQQEFDKSQALYRSSSTQKTYSKPSPSTTAYQAPRPERSESKSSMSKKKMEYAKARNPESKGINIPWNGSNVTDSQGNAYAYGSDRSYNSKAGRADSNYNSSSPTPRTKRACPGQIFTTDNGTTIELPGGILAEHREIVCMGSDNVDLTPHYYQFQCMDGEWQFFHRLYAFANDEQKERCKKHSDARVTLSK